MTVENDFGLCNGRRPIIFNNYVAFQLKDFDIIC